MIDVCTKGSRCPFQLREVLVDRAIAVALRCRRQRSDATAGRHRSDGQGSARQQRRQSISRDPGLGTAEFRGKAVGRLQRRGHRPGWQVGVGDRPMLAGDDARAVSAPKRTPSTISMSQGKRSGALAAGCSCGRTASMSIETEMCGWPTHEPRARRSSRSFPEKTTREASSSSSVPKARS